jgi:hypothetical protein
VYVFYEVSKNSPSVSWGVFRKKCAAFGLTLGKTISAREVRDQVLQTRLLSLTSPENH